jgi:hypothetical protein
MDFPANTVARRRWFKALCSKINAPHELIYINVSDETCLEQIALPSIEQPKREAYDTKAVFHHVTRFIEKPGAGEGVNIK